MQKFLTEVVGTLVKRYITLGVGYLVASGLVPEAVASQLGPQLEFVVTGLVLTVVYGLYDKFLKPHALKLLSLAVKDAIAGK